MHSQVALPLLIFSALNFLCSTTALARDAARDLRNMVGWTILDSTSVSSVDRSGYFTILRLANGHTVRLSSCSMLPPLPMSDAIIFGKKVGNGGLLRIMIDNEICDIIPV